VFVDWRSVNAMFSGAMWLVVLVLVLVILAHHLPAPPAPPIHHAPMHAVAR
jgi:hypothetical protein